MRLYLFYLFGNMTIYLYFLTWKKLIFQRNLSKLHNSSALPAKVSWPLMSHPAPSRKSSSPLVLKTIKKIEGGTDKCSSPPPVSKITSPASSSTKKLPNSPLPTESTLLSSSVPKESSPESKLIRDWASSTTQKIKTIQRVWMLFLPWPKNSTLLVVGSPNGELF